MSNTKGNADPELRDLHKRGLGLARAAPEQRLQQSQRQRQLTYWRKTQMQKKTPRQRLRSQKQMPLQHWLFLETCA